MSNTKTIMGQASNQYVAPLDVEEVFSTYLYYGTGSAGKTVNNGIDLSGEGGLVVFKQRNLANNWAWFDTERGTGKAILSNDTDAEESEADTLTSFNSNGFTVSDDNKVNTYTTTHSIASWTFRKAPKFFDVVTWTGDGTHPRTFNHSLNCSIGFMATKETNASGNWTSFHRGLANGFGTGRVYLNAINSVENESLEFLTSNNSSFTLTSDTGLNSNGVNYVAYLFAHNDGDGGFGPDGDADIIKCGTIDGNQTVDLGFEPQWVMIKRYDATGNWYMLDTMRGMPVGSDNANIYANRTNAEVASGEVVRILPNGLQSVVSANHIYMAIRRPTKVPESGTEVFAPVFHNDDSSEINVSGGFTADAFISKRRSGGATYMTPRLLGGQTLQPDTTGSEFDYSTYVGWDTQEGVNFTGWFGSVTDGIDWQWKRAPNFCDVVAYTGTGIAGRTVSHNLTVAPEMMWIKQRDQARDWFVYHTGTDATAPEDYLLKLNTTAAASFNTTNLNSTAPTSSVFTVGSPLIVNRNNYDYIAYLFASLDGVSKVGSYNGNNSSQTIDCGFTSGARFVLIKASSRSGSWAVWDSARGITTGDDPRLELNSTSPEQSQSNIDVEPHSSGFIIDSTSGEFNEAGETYIFYAIA